MSVITQRGHCDKVWCPNHVGNPNFASTDRNYTFADPTGRFELNVIGPPGGCFHGKRSGYLSPINQVMLGMTGWNSGNPPTRVVTLTASNHPQHTSYSDDEEGYVPPAQSPRHPSPPPRHPSPPPRHPSPPRRRFPASIGGVYTRLRRFVVDNRGNAREDRAPVVTDREVSNVVARDNEVWVNGRRIA